jgi:hypothetical protein
MLEGVARPTIRRDPNGASVATPAAPRIISLSGYLPMPAKRRNGVPATPDTVSSLVALLQGPAANSFVVSQRLALEAARFWARRMHAYADQMETLAGCTTPDEMAAAQTRFIERMRDDYAAESKALGDLVAPPTRRARRGNGEHAEA